MKYNIIKKNSNLLLKKYIKNIIIIINKNE